MYPPVEKYHFFQQKGKKALDYQHCVSGEGENIFVPTFLSGIVVWDLDNIWVGKWDTPTPTFSCSLKMYVFLLYRTNTQRLLMERNIFAQEVHCICEVSLFFVLMDMP